MYDVYYLVYAKDSIDKNYFFHPKRCRGGEGLKCPYGQEIGCHLSQNHAKVTKILDFYIHKHPN